MSLLLYFKGLSVNVRYITFNLINYVGMNHRKRFCFLSESSRQVGGYVFPVIMFPFSTV